MSTVNPRKSRGPKRSVIDGDNEVSWELLGEKLSLGPVLCQYVGEHKDPKMFGNFYFRPVLNRLVQGDIRLTSQRSKLLGALAGVVASHCVLAFPPTL